MKKIGFVFGVLLLAIGLVSPAFAAYHHEGEVDSPNFLTQYPETAGHQTGSLRHVPHRRRI